MNQLKPRILRSREGLVVRFCLFPFSITNPYCIVEWITIQCIGTFFSKVFLTLRSTYGHFRLNQFISIVAGIYVFCTTNHTFNVHPLFAHSNPKSVRKPEDLRICDVFSNKEGFVALQLTPPTNCSYAYE